MQFKDDDDDDDNGDDAYEKREMKSEAEQGRYDSGITHNNRRASIGSRLPLFN